MRGERKEQGERSRDIRREEGGGRREEGGGRREEGGEGGEERRMSKGRYEEEIEGRAHINRELGGEMQYRKG